MYLDELSITSEATNETPDLDVCDFTHCNGMLLTAEINGQTGMCLIFNKLTKGMITYSFNNKLSLFPIIVVIV